MKKRLLVAIVSLTVLLAGPWVIPTLTPWTAVNVHHEEINIKTGQARYSHKLWYIKISEKVEDTLFSRVLAGETVDVADIEPWHMVNTFSPGQRYSPNYAFHGALAQARTVEVIFKLREPDAQRKQQIVRDILKLWQTKGDYFEAGRYVATLSEETAKETER
jgi:hypothetical protein